MKTSCRYLWIWVLVCFVIAGSLASSDSDKDDHDESDDRNEAYKTYIVHMFKPHMPSSFESHEMWYSSLVKSLYDGDDDEEDEEEEDKDKEKEEEDEKPEILYNYDEVLHGFAAKLKPDQAEDLEEKDGVLGVQSEAVYELHKAQNASFLGLNSTDGLGVTTNNADEVVIGVLDTGVWPESPSFSDDGMKPMPSHWKGECESGTQFDRSHCNKKLIGARFFCKGYETQNGPMNEAKEFRSPRDNDGHGTHTASTAAGSFVSNATLLGYVRGVAPSARIAVYKVCWLGGCFGSDILAAMESALKDGVNVLSASLGGEKDVSYYRDVIALGAFSAMEKGIFVSSSAGNDGPDARSLVNVAPWISTVGASALKMNSPPTVVLGNAKNSTNVTTTINRTVLDINPSPKVAVFSSRGPNPLTPQILKPDIVAPGVDIVAAWTGFVGPSKLNFNELSGTSMSSAHVSGVAALLKGAHPDWSPAAIRSALMTTARATVDNTDKVYTPYDHGAGNVDAQKALKPGLIYDMGVRDYVEFLCALSYTHKHIKMVAKKNVECRDDETKNPGNINYPSFSVVFGENHHHGRKKYSFSVVKYTRTVTNVGPGSSTYKVAISAPPSVRVSVRPEVLSFESKNEKKTYSITFEATTPMAKARLGSFGSITWSDRTHEVRSPVAFAWHS